MSWIARRTTSRSEDIAYCMLGLFDVNMSPSYGEGKKAFMRLQLEMIKKKRGRFNLCVGLETRWLLTYSFPRHWNACSGAFLIRRVAVCRMASFEKTDKAFSTCCSSKGPVRRLRQGNIAPRMPNGTGPSLTLRSMRPDLNTTTGETFLHCAARALTPTAANLPSRQ